jgi:citrate synthase
VLTHRGNSVRQLCGRASFEEVAYLLWHGERPTREQLVAQNRSERARRALSPAVAAAIADQPVTDHPLDTLRTAVTLLGASGPIRRDASAAAIAANGLSLFAAVPTIIAMDQRRRHGLGAVAPREDLDYAPNFLYMTFGKVPEPQVVAAFEASLTLYAADSGDPADLPACPVAALPARPHSVVAATVGALRTPDADSGGGTVVAMLNEIAIPDNAAPWLEDALAAGRTIAGFGQPVDGGEDPRVQLMRARLSMIAALRRGESLVAVYDALVTAMYDAQRRRPSLDLPAGPALHLIGFDGPSFMPVIAAARLPGWTARLGAQFAASSIIAAPPASDDSAGSRQAGGQCVPAAPPRRQP